MKGEKNMMKTEKREEGGSGGSLYTLYRTV